MLKMRFSLKPIKLQRSALAAAVTSIISFQASPGVMAQGDPKVEEIVVTAGSYEQSLRTAPASISVITGSDLRERNVTDVLQAVRETEGITLDPTGGSSNRASVSIRGMGRDYSLMLVNGRRISASDEVIQHSDFRLDWVPMELVERIEIVRGPMSSLYGSEAFGGVVNVITKPAEDQWYADVRMQLGGLTDGDGGEEFNGSAMAAGPLTEDISVTVGGGYFSRANQDYPDDIREPALTMREGRRGENVVLGAIYTPSERHRFDLDYYRTNEDRSPYRLESVTGENIIYKLGIDITREHSALTYRGDFDSFDARLSVYRSEVISSTSTVDSRIPAAISPKQGQVNEVIDGGVSFVVAERHTVAMGFESLSQSHIHQSFTGGKAKQNIFSLYLQDEIELSDELRLTLGLRSDEEDNFGTELSPRAYVVYLPSDKLTLRAGYGHGFKAPHLKYTTPGYESGRPGYNLISNPDLEPEVVDGLELGFDYQFDTVSLGVRLFDNSLENLLVSETLKLPVRVRGAIVENGEFRRVNVDEATIKGAEVSLNADFSSGFDASLNYTYLDAMNETSDTKLTDRPGNTVNFRLGWQGDSGWSAQFRVNYVGEQYISVGRGAAATLQALPDFTLYHLSLGKTLTDNITLRAGVDNLTDVDLLDESPLFTYSDRGRYAFLSIEARFN